ncbi:MAG: hypothetical protein VX265_05250 [Myxococcota bacterium]|nr:hypothetical protein [Myxococcota bacterium]
MPAARVTELPLPSALLEVLGATSVRAVPDPDPARLVPLLRDLADEDCGHSWRTSLHRDAAHPPAERAARLLQREQAMRPTTVWLYVAAGPDGERPLAVATLSDRVRADFPHEGFPVLARAYVAPRARGHGLYRHLVLHRLGRCQAHWGRRLRAVHIGAADRPVDQTINRTDLPLRFVYVGDEGLRVAGRTWRVRDYVAFTPSFLRSMPSSPPSLRAFMENGADAVPYGALRPLIAHPLAPGPRQLRDLLDAIGVLP